MGCSIKAAFMEMALLEAKKAFDAGEMPVGAIIVKDGQVIARAHNMRESKKSTLSHAECEAIRIANEVLGDWRLDGCTIYVTLEPCMMCMGAILNSRISELVFGAYDLQKGAAESRIDLSKTGEKPPVIYAGIKEDKCKRLLDRFFKEIRE